MKNLWIIFLFVIFIISLAFKLYDQNVANAEINDKVFSAKDMPYNHTMNYWVQKWFDWFLSLPNVEGNVSLAHPRDNYSPEKCSWNQDYSEPVWMLSDGRDRNDLSKMEIRDCKVPAGKSLLVQIVGSNCSMEEGLKNEQELMQCAVWVLPKAQFSATIDGNEVMNTNKDPNDRNKFYVQPFFTNVTYSKNNYYGASEGTYKGAEAGYFLFVKALPVGNHEIKFQESAINTLDSTGNDKRISSVQYNVIVQNMTKQ
jgi:hypothetical protein